MEYCICLVKHCIFNNSCPATMHVKIMLQMLPSNKYHGFYCRLDVSQHYAMMFKLQVVESAEEMSNMGKLEELTLLTNYCLPNNMSADICT